MIIDPYALLAGASFLMAARSARHVYVSLREERVRLARLTRLCLRRPSLQARWGLGA
jgi:hypothetical protein